ncbi:MAG: sensor histidine kinase [Bacillota bacterium]
MDIKLKKFSHSIIIKFLLFIFIVLSFTFFINLLIGTDGKDYQVLEVLSDENYFDSTRFDKNFRYKLNKIRNKLVNKKLRVDIENGDTITKEKIKNRLAKRIDNEKLLEIDFSLLETKYKEEIAKIKKDIKSDELRENLKEFQKYEIKDLNYFVSSDGISVSNVEESKVKDFKKNDFHIIINDKNRLINPKTAERFLYSFPNYYNRLEEISDEIYLTISNEKLNQEIKNWEKDRIKAENLFKRLILTFILGIVAFIWLVVITGRDSETKKINLNTIDKLHVDTNILVIIGLLTLLFFSFEGLINTTLKNDTKMYFYYITVVISTFGLMLILSLVRHLKNKTFFKNTISYSIISKIFSLIKRLCFNLYDILKTLFNVKAFGYKVIRLSDLNEIKKGSKKIREGNLDYKINVKNKGVLKDLSKEINMIAQGLKKAVNNEVKSQKMKTELITNVSHDIRTPLTSIITYIDLIKSEKSKEKQKEYIEVIDKKSQRLKTLTDDLFEMSKVSSGNINFEKEKIDLVSLINQVLGEFEKNIKNSDLDFKVDLKEENNIFINADGKLLYRAIENIFSNIFKYALVGSRVYIDVVEKNNRINIIFKNISKYELNISEQELMERFTRGDRSRNSEGSGLGLSISKSLMEVQDAKFKIKIDGDLFKVILDLEKWDFSEK